MLPPRIQTTKLLRNELLKKRIDKGLSLEQLADSINKTVSYLSAIEKGRVKSISSKDLIIIFRQLFDISDNEAESKIEEIMLNVENVKLCQYTLKFDYGENTDQLFQKFYTVLLKSYNIFDTNAILKVLIKEPDILKKLL